MSSASDYDPNINEQQNATESDPSNVFKLMIWVSI